MQMVYSDQLARKEIQVILGHRGHRVQLDSAAVQERLAPLELLVVQVSQGNRVNRVLPDLPEFPERSANQVT